MSLPDVPFGPRLVALLVVMALGAGADLAARGRAARRPREYAFLLAAGALGAAFALLCDQVTSRLSPEYFVIGKGLDPGPGFARAVVTLSLQAGFVAGVVLGGVLLLSDQPRPDRPTLPLPRLLLRAGWPLLGALLLAPVGALVLPPLDPLGLRRELGPHLPAGALEGLLRVWGGHAGLYAGGLAGTIAGALEVRRRRRLMAAGRAPRPGP